MISIKIPDRNQTGTAGSYAGKNRDGKPLRVKNERSHMITAK
ncbi:hypothetical protein [Runella sp.]